jgi:hypothetical protein
MFALEMSLSPVDRKANTTGIFNPCLLHTKISDLLFFTNISRFRNLLHSPRLWHISLGK